jgi:hypothetical protein
VPENNLKVEDVFPRKEVIVPVEPIVQTPVGDSLGSIKDQILNLFQDGKEYTVKLVVERLKVRNPTVLENTVRATITQLKVSGLVRDTRREGREIFLKLNEYPQEQMPKRKTSVGSVISNTEGIGGADDALILKNAMKALSDLEGLIERYSALAAQIQAIKRVL